MRDGEHKSAPGPDSLLDLFLTFTKLALHGFGGVLPWAQRALVEQKRWITREEFVELLAFSQLLPGPNIINLSIIVGDRFFGWRGALVGPLGMLLAPAVGLVLVFLMYSRFSGLEIVQQAMSGMAAVAAGLIMATAIKMALTFRKRWQWLGFGAAAFVLVAILHTPLLTSMALLLPLALAAAGWAERGEGSDR